MHSIFSELFEISLSSEILEIWIHYWRTSKVPIKLGHWRSTSVSLLFTQNTGGLMPFFLREWHIVTKIVIIGKLFFSVEPITSLYICLVAFPSRTYNLKHIHWTRECIEHRAALLTFILSPDSVSFPSNFCKFHRILAFIFTFFIVQLPSRVYW